jgi:hypothetical protein
LLQVATSLGSFNDGGGSTLLIRPGRRHAVNESTNLGGQAVVALVNQNIVDSLPSAQHAAARFDQLGSGRFEFEAAGLWFTAYGLGSFIVAIRCISLHRAITCAAHWRVDLTADRAFGGIRCDALFTEMCCISLPPVAQRRFANIQSHASLTDGLHDQVHMRMGFVGMGTIA